ncbi:unnamed protein product [Enterobius vermicularis]|uniref:ZP domain-containing protein n=1 Tax=Enterobius vermicularis TaxID=51028 RepID=A0A3P6IHT5_ENTVE|nr:unnamed protein product [Enterobius vermicularis]
MLQIINLCDSFDNDNAVEGLPELFCDPNSISIVFKSQKPFVGRTFVKGYVLNERCVQYGEGNTAHRFTVPLDQCGVRRYREFNGLSATTTVIISFHKLFITKIDKAYHLRCFYIESLQTLSQHMDVSAMTTVELVKQTKLPVCRYEILTGGPAGKPVQFVRVGDVVYHKWSCKPTAEELYCMKVHSCVVYDGQGGDSVELVDKNGCASEPTVLPDLEYLGDLITGQQTNVFKFADRSSLYFSCQIELLVKDPYTKCASARPQCKLQTSNTATSEEDEGVSDEEYSASMASAAPDEQLYDILPIFKDTVKGLRKIANVDLPEQSLIVFGVESDRLPIGPFKQHCEVTGARNIMHQNLLG